MRLVENNNEKVSQNIISELNESLVESGGLYMSIPLDLFDNLVESLSSMKSYADDGMLDRNDPEYSDFFNAVDQAESVLSQAEQYRDEYMDNNSIHTMLMDDDDE
jgi:hypothetical protein